ncbi:MAG: hypothetical protein ACLSWY_13695 [Ruthenibacterium lactatiformans]
MPAVITNEMVFAALPPRPPESHKGAYGRVLAVCGCPAYRGAAALSVLGALRAGAGVVTLAAGESVIKALPRAFWRPQSCRCRMKARSPPWPKPPPYAWRAAGVKPMKPPRGK